MNGFFEDKSFIKFLISEFKTRRKTNRLYDVFTSILNLYTSGVPNYYIKKEWNKKYIAITNDIQFFHQEIDCSFNGSTPKWKDHFLNFDNNKITFDFQKTHLIITSKALYFFPYNLPDENSAYKSLHDNFKLVFKENKLSKEHKSDQNLTFKSLNNSEEKTIITFKVHEFNEDVQLMLNAKIGLPKP